MSKKIEDLDLTIIMNDALGNGISGNGISGNGISGNGLSGNGISGNGFAIDNFDDIVNSIEEIMLREEEINK